MCRAPLRQHPSLLPCPSLLSSPFSALFLTEARISPHPILETLLSLPEVVLSLKHLNPAMPMGQYTQLWELARQEYSVGTQPQKEEKLVSRPPDQSQAVNKCELVLLQEGWAENSEIPAPGGWAYPRAQDDGNCPETVVGWLQAWVEG